MWTQEEHRHGQKCSPKARARKAMGSNLCKQEKKEGDQTTRGGVKVSPLVHLKLSLKK